ncbi:MAG: histidine kinase [Clostridium sp.]|nr:histidine kinase [Clostridium sp.]
MNFNGVFIMLITVVVIFAILYRFKYSLDMSFEEYKYFSNSVEYKEKEDVLGKKAMLEFTSPYYEYADKVNYVFYGNKEKIILDLVEWRLTNLFLSFFIIIIGIFIIIIKFLLKDEISNSIFYLGILFLLFGNWSLMTSGVRVVLSSTGNIYFRAFTLLLIPVIFLLYIKELYSLKECKVIKVQIILYFFSFIIIFILKMFNINYVIQLVFITLCFMICIIGYTIVTVFIKNGYYLKYKFIQTVGFLILTFSLLREIFIEKYYTGVYIGFGWSVFLLIQLMIILLDTVDKLQERKKLKCQLEKSKIKLMSRQLEPHFYSNVLISIQDLCYRNPKQAADTISLFYSYIRRNMNFIEMEELICFEEELSQIKIYMEVQNICFGNEIKYVEDIKTRSFFVPPLTIQPIVENAIKHGIRKKEGEGTVKLSTFVSGECVFIIVEDNGIGFDVSKLEDVNILFSSFRNIKYRLEKLSNANIVFESEIGVGTKVTIKIPLDNGGDFIEGCYY